LNLYLGFVLVFFHVLLVIVWLGLDFAVFTLSMGTIDRKQPIVVRIDRARMAERFDFWVLKAFLVTTPLGLVVAHIRGYDFVSESWIALKISIMGLIFFIALVLISGAAGTSVLLQRIADCKTPEQAEKLEQSLRRRVIGLAYPVWVLYLCIMANVFIGLTKWIF